MTHLQGLEGALDDRTSPALTSTTGSGPASPPGSKRASCKDSADALGGPQVCTFLAAALQEQVPGCKGHLLLWEGKGRAPGR